MRKSICILFVLINLSLFSQTYEINITNEDFITSFQETDERGVNITIYELKTNLPDGEYTVYYDSLKTIKYLNANILNSQKYGIWRFYNENGNLKRITNFVNNVKDGEEHIYFSNGNLSELRNYENNLLNGYRYFYNSEETEILRQNYINGQLIK